MLFLFYKRELTVLRSIDHGWEKIQGISNFRFIIINFRFSISYVSCQQKVLTKKGNGQKLEWRAKPGKGKGVLFN